MAAPAPLLQPDAGARAEIAEFLDAHDGAAVHHLPFTGAAWDELVAREPGRFAAAVTRDDDGRPIGFAQAGRPTTDDRWVAEMVVSGTSVADVGASLLVTLARTIAANGGGRVDLWATEPTPGHVEAATRAAFEPFRTLVQMKRPLPLDEATVRSALDTPDGPLRTRPFRPGHDEDAFLEVNRISFADHPDQWRLDRAELDRTMAEPWFDSDGFLLTEADSRLAGFCWTKEFADLDPPEGEIHVIGVHPDFGGRGLGRALVVAGLAHLASRGMGVAMLFVEGDNDAARALYTKLGFDITRTDRAFTRTIEPR
ncbi:MAG: mycothiol synthase [Actinomycetota bacterium]|nr:mycothiol synthase [Actinomycetota bacterium]